MTSCKGSEVSIMEKQRLGRKTVAAAVRVVALLSVFVWSGGARMTEAKTGMWNTTGPEAGTIDALAVDPWNPQTVYAAVREFGLAGPHIFKSADGAGTWSDVSSDLISHGAVRMVIDPRTPTTLYAASMGDGVFKTTDGGHTWVAASNGLPSQVFIDALVIDPQSQDTLYVVSYGLFKTTDGGDNWFPVTSGLPQPTDVRAVAIDPQNPATLYASTYLSGIFRSTDGGGNWSQVSGTMKGVTALAIDPRTRTILYAGTWCQGLFKSVDAGVTWRGTSLIGDGMCVSSVVVDPQTPTTLYVNGSSRSTDGAATWSRFGPRGGAGSILAIDPQAPTTLYAGTSGSGVFKTADGGGSWHAASSGLFRPPVTVVAVDPANTGTVYAGTSTSGFFKSTDSGRSWRPAGTDLSPGASSLAIDPQVPSTLYAGVSGVFGVVRSADGGETWARIGGIDSPVTTLVIDPQTPATLYAGSLYYTPEGYHGGIHKSTDGGDTWNYIISGLIDPYDNFIIGGISRLVIDPQAPATLYANVTLRRSGSKIYKTTDGGRYWSPASGGAPEYYITALVVDPRTPTTRYAGTDFGVYKSVDGGGSWSTANTGLSSLRIDHLVIDPATPTTLYASTRQGSVFKTADGGGSWSALTDGLTHPVRDLAIDPRDTSTLYAPTTSGVFVLRQNRRPVAEAGGDRVVECAGPAGSDVALDAGGSADPDGDGLTYVWSGPFGRIEGPRPIVTLPFGLTTVTLVVSDGVEESIPDEVVVDVRDTVSPTLEVTASPAALWPPDGRLVAVGFQVAASDRCDPSPAVVLLDARSSEPQGAVDHGAPIADAEIGTDDRTISLRADRSKEGPARTYTITYRATDAAGNVTTADAVVQVPHDLRR